MSPSEGCHRKEATECGRAVCRVQCVVVQAECGEEKCDRVEGERRQVVESESQSTRGGRGL